MPAPRTLPLGRDYPVVGHPVLREWGGHRLSLRTISQEVDLSAQRVDGSRQQRSSAAPRSGVGWSVLFGVAALPWLVLGLDLNMQSGNSLHKGDAPVCEELSGFVDSVRIKKSVETLLQFSVVANVIRLDDAKPGWDASGV